MHSRKLIAGYCLLCSFCIVGTARAAERANATLRIEVRVREVVHPPQPPRKQEDSDITFSLTSESKLVKFEAEEKLDTSGTNSHSAKVRDAVLRTTTYTIE